MAEDRTYATWKALVEERLKARGTGVRSLGSDRATALIQLAEKGLECLRMPDFCPRMHDLVQSSALPSARRVRHAHQELKNAAEGLSRPPGPEGQPQDAPEAQQHVEVRRADVQRWEGGHSTYRHHLEVLSLPLHPLHIHDATPQTAEPVPSRLEADGAALET